MPEMKAPGKILMTANEVAEMLGCSRQFVYQHSSGGVEPIIPFFKIAGMVRFRSVEVEAWLEQYRGRVA